MVIKFSGQNDVLISAAVETAMSILSTIISNVGWPLSFYQQLKRLQKNMASERHRCASCYEAARNNHEECHRNARWELDIVDTESHPSTECCDNIHLAIIKDHVYCLDRLHHKGVPWDFATAATAAQYSIECLTYAHEHGCPWNKNVTSAAAYAGKLALMIYAHENGCPWDTDTLCWAIWGGNMCCWSYAVTNACPWSTTALECAAAAEDDEVLQFVIDSKKPITSLVLSAACSFGDELAWFKKLVNCYQDAEATESFFVHEYPAIMQDVLFPNEARNRLQEQFDKWSLRQKERCGSEIKPCKK